MDATYVCVVRECFAFVMTGFGRTKGKKEDCLWTGGRTCHKNGLIRSNEMSPSANNASYTV